ncbi:Oxidoreductase N-terminal [Penicillium capsulatum]|uniref:Oxidoreductase N-terminal n=1 Tax=Penicillium capsulatum TaxID=69766 RepID=A0A9W9HS64_9EURO|nr:Oxidoreductase N-terminal [Penicillium capsulatum]KAJ6105400.1 Oxidoreductase N-terminal [Penicillium capsulatum]
MPCPWNGGVSFILDSIPLFLLATGNLHLSTLVSDPPLRYTLDAIMSTPALRVGILVATDAVEHTYLPTLRSLSSHFDLTTIYASDEDIALRYRNEFNITHHAATANDVLHHPDVDVVLNLLPFEYHEPYTVAALETGKHVMVEAPVTLSIQGLRRIRAATQKGATVRGVNDSGPKLFVGCPRRYAPCFTEVFKKELASLDRILYARCRNIAGPLHVPAPKATNGTNGTTGSANGATTVSNPKHFHALLADVFGSAEDLTADRVAFCRFLGNLGVHDLSVMRESLGLPDAVANVAITDPFYSAIFHYSHSVAESHPFILLYEAGVDAVPRCDAHLTVYGANKTVSVQYDFPYPGTGICQEQAVRVVVEETETELQSNENGSGNGHAVRPRVKRTETVSSSAEAYERQFLALHAYFTNAADEVKTDGKDALMDLRLLNLIFEHYDRQCGTIRTPLG